MRVVGQIGRILPGREKLDGNAYLGMLALMGLVGWGATAYVIHFIVPPPEGVVTLRQLGEWAQATSRYTWPLMGLWGGLIVVSLGIWLTRMERGALLSVPSLVWIGGTVLAMVVNAVGIVIGDQELIWLPWFVLYTVGYLVTGVLVERGWIYLGAGVVSGVLAANGVYGYFTSSGYLIVTLQAETSLAGEVLLPVPFAYVVLGLLHVVPVGVDALMGGRQMTDEGIPKIKADRTGAGDDEDDDDGVDGVISDL